MQNKGVDGKKESAISGAGFEPDGETLQTGDGSNRAGSSKAIRTLDVITDFFSIVAGILLVMMALIVTYNVVMRYFLRSPALWAVDLTSYILVYAPFLAAAWVLREDAHVKIDIVVICLSEKWQHRLKIVVSLIGILACGLLAWHGFRATYNLYARNVIMQTMVPVHKWILVACIPLGLTFTLLQFIRLLLRLLEPQGDREA